jgi:ABC-type phosphate transport system permease subunit
MEAGGVSARRSRLAVAGARATTEAMLRNQPRGDVIRNAVFAGLLLLAVAIALAGLLALLIQAFAKGSSALSTDLVTNPPSTTPATARRSSAPSS